MEVCGECAEGKSKSKSDALWLDLLAREHPHPPNFATQLLGYRCMLPQPPLYMGAVTLHSEPEFCAAKALYLPNTPPHPTPNSLYPLAMRSVVHSTTQDQKEQSQPCYRSKPPNGRPKQTFFLSKPITWGVLLLQLKKGLSY